MFFYTIVIFSISINTPLSLPEFRDSRIFQSSDLCEIALEDFHDFYKNNNPNLSVYFSKNEKGDGRILVFKEAEAIKYHKCIRSKIHFNKQELLDEPN